MLALNFSICVFISCILSLFADGSNPEAPENQRPNILFIMADDCTYSEIGCYGGLNAKTPNIDKLAGEGLIFKRAYVSMAMCVPARHELYTGLYPMESGCVWNQGMSKPGTKSIFHYLTEQGYRVGISGKKHAEPKEVFPYINIPGFEADCVNANEKKEDITGIKRFMEEKNDEPFCLFVCSTNPHAPWTMGDASAYPPDKLKLPAHLGNTPEVREAYSRYLAEVTYFDRQVGEVLKILDERGKASNTLVMVSTEQGWAFSGGKWTNWDLGVHTGLIAKWPGKIKPGTKTEALVQFADITPTFIDIAEGEKVTAISGTSFKDVLLGKKDEHRKYVYCMHNNVPEGKPYPIRSVISVKYHYIHNLLHDSTYFEIHIEGGYHGDVWWERWKQKANTSAREKYLVDRFYHRPAEEFYAVDTDKEEFNNLSGNPKFKRELERHRKALDKWMKSQNDPGARVDTEIAFEKKYWGN